jgi:hypothetical protein
LGLERWGVIAENQMRCTRAELIAGCIKEKTTGNMFCIVVALAIRLAVFPKLADLNAHR